ncbi:MAG: FAD-dependent oxidoreductase [Ignisphaera sp.]|uniref:4Fe-4S ferredoxin-type domain-containing protein n=1 Tax=Ignisphaera aggregans TaxID=334771 RepID=A0A7C4JK19_9CREN
MKFAFLCKEPLYTIKKRIAIIGAGPAGLAVTGYFACRGYEVDVYDKLPYPGGLMSFAIPRYRIPFEEILEGWKDLEQNFGVKFFLRTKVSVGEGHDEGDEFVEKKIDLTELSGKYDGIIVATGTWRSRYLRIEGENAKNVVTALNFLYKRRLAELGLAKNNYIGNFNKVVIIGAGLSAVDVAEECLLIGVKEIYLTYRRTIKEAPAGSYKIKELITRGVKWVDLVQPQKILVDNGYAKGVEFVKVELGSLDETGRPKPMPISGTEHIIEADMVILAVGETPSPPIYSGNLVKYLDSSGKLIVGNDYRIPNTNIFAVGDVVLGPSKVGLAIDHALKAAKIIDIALSGEKIRVEDILKKLRRVQKTAIELSTWNENMPKTLCGFLSKYVEVDLNACTSMAPFVRIFDYIRCIGCESCNAICGFVHDGKSYIKIKKTDEGLVIPTSCFHCVNAKCQASCKRDAIVRGDLGEIIIDIKKCNKCMDCLYACPIKAIRISRGEIVNCDLCFLLRKGGLKPACISMCPAKALIIVAKPS